MIQVLNFYLKYLLETRYFRPLKNMEPNMEYHYRENSELSVELNATLS
jgi:hypothetical protein